MLQLLLFKITSTFLHAQFRGLIREFIHFLIMSSFSILRLVECVVCCESSFACEVQEVVERSKVW